MAKVAFCATGSVEDLDDEDGYKCLNKTEKMVVAMRVMCQSPTYQPTFQQLSTSLLARWERFFLVKFCHILRSFTAFVLGA